MRADTQFKHLSDDESARQKEIAEWKAYRGALVKSDIYKTLYEKWDLYIPFLERAYQLLRPTGEMVFIIPDSYNAAKYAKKSHEFFLANTRIARVDFCSDIPLFKAGVYNTILHFTRSNPTAFDTPLRVHRWGEKPDDFEANAEILTSKAQLEFGKDIFKLGASGVASSSIGNFITLDKVCYISYGLRANADDRNWQGEFSTGDCLSEHKDKTHPKPFVQGKDLLKWFMRRNLFLEWGTERAPNRFSRPTFP